jgi:hypothetical protein
MRKMTRNPFKALLLGATFTVFAAACTDEPIAFEAPGEGDETSTSTVVSADVGIASHDMVDLTTPLTWATLANGALALSGPHEQGTGAGTFPSFLLVGRTSANVGKGYNTDASGPNRQYEISGGSNSRSIPLNSVPAIEYEGTVYREFRFDGQAPGSGKALYSLDDLRIYLVPNVAPNNAISTFLASSILGPRAGLGAGATALGAGLRQVWDMNPGVDFDLSFPFDYTWIRANANLSSGQGQDDIKLFVPDELFRTAINNDDDWALCAHDGFDYAATGGTTGLGSACPWLIYFVHAHGWADSKESGNSEWAIAVRPVLEVTKTAVGSYDREVEWDIEKTVDIDAHTLETSQSGDSEYTVTVTKVGENDFNHRVNGTITVLNTSSQDVVITAIEDVFQFQGEAPIQIGFADLDCPAIPSLPHTIPGGATRTCTYFQPVELSNGLPEGRNTVTVIADDPLSGGLDFSLAYSGFADVEWDDEPTAIFNEEVNVDDTYEGDLGSFTGTGSVSYTRTFTCDEDEGLHENTATIIETEQSDDADVNVICVRPVLEVEKDADPEFDREYFWDIEKTVDIDEHTLAGGESGDSEYTVTVTQTGYEDSDFRVSGTITITNPATFATAKIEDVTDVLNGTTATVDCGVTFPYDLGPGDALICTYGSDLPDATTLTNTATAIVHEDSPVDGGYGTAEVDFDGVDPTDVTNDEVNVDDTYAGDLGSFTGTGSVSYTRTFTCFQDEGLHENTATIIETGQSDDADVSVICLAPGTETAWASNELGVPLELPYNPEDGGNWATYVQYEAGKITTFFAGRTHEVGTVEFSAVVNGEVTITINLTGGWAFDPSNDLAVQGYETAPSGNPAPGLFDNKEPASGSSHVIMVPAANFYGVHGVVMGGGE